MSSSSESSAVFVTDTPKQVGDGLLSNPLKDLHAFRYLTVVVRISHGDTAVSSLSSLRS